MFDLIHYTLVDRTMGIENVLIYPDLIEHYVYEDQINNIKHVTMF